MVRITKLVEVRKTVDVHRHRVCARRPPADIERGLVHMSFRPLGTRSERIPALAIQCEGRTTTIAACRRGRGGHVPVGVGTCDGDAARTSVREGSGDEAQHKSKNDGLQYWMDSGDHGFLEQRDSNLRRTGGGWRVS